jgi:hypothetical protein
MNNLDWKQYIANYQDLQKAGIDNSEKAWGHYTRYGKNENITDIEIFSFSK